MQVLRYLIRYTEHIQGIEVYVFLKKQNYGTSMPKNVSSSQPKHIKKTSLFQVFSLKNLKRLTKKNSN